VLGPPGAGKTAFLESLAWEAVGDHRPSLYYALRTGTMRVWERLISTLGAILQEPGVSPDVLRAHELAPEGLETLGRLDALLQSSVLPFVTLIDATPASTASVGAFIEDVLARSLEAGEHHGRLPLVLVDDLGRLAELTGSRSPLGLISRLGDALAADSLPGFVTGEVDPACVRETEWTRLQSVLVLHPIAPSSSELPRRVDLEVRHNATTGWTGTVPVLLDPSSGLFAESVDAR
jgi:hypothetical protein